MSFDPSRTKLQYLSRALSGVIEESDKRFLTRYSVAYHSQPSEYIPPIEFHKGIALHFPEESLSDLYDIIDNADSYVKLKKMARINPAVHEAFQNLLVVAALYNGYNND